MIWVQHSRRSQVIALLPDYHTAMLPPHPSARVSQAQSETSHPNLDHPPKSHPSQSMKTRSSETQFNPLHPLFLAMNILPPPNTCPQLPRPCLKHRIKSSRLSILGLESGTAGGTSRKMYSTSVLMAIRFCFSKSSFVE